MKIFKIASFSILAGIALLAFLPAGNTSSAENEYLRIHIRANSNLDADQNVKYAVKDGVVDLLTPYLVDATSKEKAIDIISSLTSEIESVCNQVLREYGYDYTAKASIRNEEFPTRAYDDFVLDAGFYDALIIELGTGEGNNWWCVVYPPLCFVNKFDNSIQNIKYKSKLLEIIDRFFG